MQGRAAAASALKAAEQGPGQEKDTMMQRRVRVRFYHWLGQMAVLLAALLAVPAFAASGQPAMWRAQWIADPAAPAQGPGVHHFRKTFDLAAVPSHLVVRVSADNRYRLYINGREVAQGPARGDRMNWRYESVDIAPYLVPGRNVIAALVTNMGDLRPAAQVSVRTAFLLQAEEAATLDLDTGRSRWKVLTSEAHTFAPVVGDDSGGFYVAGPHEAVDAAKVPWGWQQPGFDDTRWTEAAPVSIPFGHSAAVGQGGNPYGGASEWQLVPRNIPMLEHSPARFAAVRRAKGIAVPGGFLAGKAALVVPSRSRVSLLLDQGALTMGHPILRTSGGEGAIARLTYAEALFDAQGNKGNRNEIDGKTIRGVHDRIRFDGGYDRTFQPLWLRAWRYVQLDIETGDAPLRIEDLSSIFTGYPFVQNATFASDARWLDPIWQMNWRALRMSAYETFWDTPYYEQLQYIGDTRIESLLSVYQSGDVRLMRNAIAQFDQSRLAEGLTASSYPSGQRQQIPPFSLWWVAMVHDYWMLRDDNAFVRDRLEGVRAVLGWYERRVDAEGMVGAAPWWNFVDWTEPFPRGVPPGGETAGQSTVITLQFVYALQRAVELERALGRPADAERYARLAESLIAAVRRRTWHPARGLFADTPDQTRFSQHANVLAILTGAVPAEHRRAVMEKVLADPSLTQASFYFRFYVDEAMRQAGLADRYLERLEPWRDMIRRGMTTTAETPEPSRSDSHAWSAHPNYQLLATVLGIRPASPGFRTVAVEPALGLLQKASGAMPHPEGRIEASYSRSGSGLRARIVLPGSLTGTFRFNGMEVPLDRGANMIECRTRCINTGSN